MQENFTPLLVVAVAMRDESGRWLMHRRPEGKDHAGLWEFPGGKVEPGETVQAALVREIAEEASVELDTASIEEAGFAVSDDAAGGRGIVILLYTATQWRGMLAAREGGTLGWFDQREIEALPKPPLDVMLARQLLRQTS